MTDLRRNKSEWRTELTDEEAGEFDALAARAMTIDAEREELTAKLNRIRQRCCQRLLAKTRKTAQ